MLVKPKKKGDGKESLMNEDVYFDGEAIEEPEFVGEFYDLSFDVFEVVDSDED